MFRGGTRIATVAAGTQGTFDDTTFEAGQNLSYVVWTTGASGQLLKASNAATTYVPPRPTPPAPPTTPAGVTAESTPATPLLQSAVSLTDEGIKLTFVGQGHVPARFNIYRSADGVMEGGPMVMQWQGGTYTDRSAIPGVEYTYAVSAVNGDFESPLSGTQAATYDPGEQAPLPTPRVTDGLDTDGKLSAYVSWPAVPGVDTYTLYIRTPQADGSTLTQVHGGLVRTFYVDHDVPRADWGDRIYSLVPLGPDLPPSPVPPPPPTGGGGDGAGGDGAGGGGGGTGG
ncbi:MAG TPA: hypothetical protein VF796_29690, partial [Humisphaera sp.]